MPQLPTVNPHSPGSTPTPTPNLWRTWAAAQNWKCYTLSSRSLSLLPSCGCKMSQGVMAALSVSLKRSDSLFPAVPPDLWWCGYKHGASRYHLFFRWHKRFHSMGQIAASHSLITSLQVPNVNTAPRIVCQHLPCCSPSEIADCLTELLKATEHRNRKQLPAAMVAVRDLLKCCHCT